VRRIWNAVAAAFVLVALGSTARAEYPDRPIRLVVGFAAGGGADILVRYFGEKLAALSGATVVVENKPGAAGNLGTDAVAKAEPDGATIGISIGGPLAINPLLFAKMPYDTARDLIPVTILVTQPSALAVPASLGVNSVAELIALLKREPGKYNYGSIGNGSLSHLAMEAIALKSGTQVVHVPYTSSPQAMTALLRGDVQMACLPAIAVTPHLASGNVRILAVSTAQRSSLLPGIPTLKEAGIDVEADAWNGLIAPAKTSDTIVAKLHREVVEAITSPAIRAKLATQLMEPIGNSPAQFRARIEADVARWAPVIRAANIKIN
jgi:tripartite-type tricarboxylate transporter receptor subunit TctC